MQKPETILESAIVDKNTAGETKQIQTRNIQIEDPHVHQPDNRKTC